MLQFWFNIPRRIYYVAEKRNHIVIVLERQLFFSYSFLLSKHSNVSENSWLWFTVFEEKKNLLIVDKITNISRTRNFSILNRTICKKNEETRFGYKLNMYDCAFLWRYSNCYTSTHRHKKHIHYRWRACLSYHFTVKFCVGRIILHALECNQIHTVIAIWAASTKHLLGHPKKYFQCMFAVVVRKLFLFLGMCVCQKWLKVPLILIGV